MKNILEYGEILVGTYPAETKSKGGKNREIIYHHTLYKDDKINSSMRLYKIKSDLKIAEHNAS